MSGENARSAFSPDILNTVIAWCRRVCLLVGWEPGAGDAWDNMTLFDFQGSALPSIAVYQGAGASPWQVDHY